MFNLYETSDLSLVINGSGLSKYLYCMGKYCDDISFPLQDLVTLVLLNELSLLSFPSGCYHQGQGKNGITSHVV